jgi:carbon storage regulator
MLVLTRKVGSQVIIGEGPKAITMTIIDIDRGRIRLGIEAPREVPIVRTELLAPKPPTKGNA